MWNSLDPSCLGSLWFRTWMSVFLPRSEKFSAIIFLSYFSALFSHFLFGSPIMWVLECLVLSQRSLNLSSYEKVLFLFSTCAFHYLFSRSLIYSSIPSYLLLITSNVFCISVIAFFSCDFLKYYLSLCWSFSEFMQSSLKSSEHLYDYYLELFIR